MTAAAAVAAAAATARTDRLDGRTAVATYAQFARTVANTVVHHGACHLYSVAMSPPSLQLLLMLLAGLLTYSTVSSDEEYTGMCSSLCRAD